MIQCENLVKIYKTKETEVIALQGLDLTVEDGELMAIIGNSGSGKSTLLNMIGGLDRPSAGTLLVDNKNLLKFNQRDYVRYKRETVGFIWQNNARNLIPYMTALDNVQLPMVLTSKKKRRQRAKELLEIVGLSHRVRSKLSQLSGGEQQRVALARAFVTRPKILFADEPTGNLDQVTGGQISELLFALNREHGTTLVLVTHDVELGRRCQRLLRLRDGRLHEDSVRTEAEPVGA